MVAEASKFVSKLWRRKQSDLMRLVQPAIGRVSRPSRPEQVGFPFLGSLPLVLIGFQRWIYVYAACICASNKLVSQIKSSTKIRVVGHADGVCHVYIDKSADMAIWQNVLCWMQKLITQQPAMQCLGEQRSRGRRCRRSRGHRESGEVVTRGR